jgi:predicted double-glycine peptidase
MSSSNLTAIALAMGLLSVAVPQAFAGSVALNSSDGTVNVPVQSFKELPFRTVVRQEFDNSCGSAAVATLLTYHFERPTTEHEAFVAMWEAGDKERIQREGFSLLKMKEEKFMEVWKNGLVFAIHNADEIGRQHFDSDREWALMPSFDVKNAVSRASLQSFTIALPAFNESLK